MNIAPLGQNGPNILKCDIMRCGVAMGACRKAMEVCGVAMEGCAAAMEGCVVAMEACNHSTRIKSSATQLCSYAAMHIHHRPHHQSNHHHGYPYVFLHVHLHHHLHFDYRPTAKKVLHGHHTEAWADKELESTAKRRRAQNSERELIKK